MYLWPKSKEG